MKTLPDVIAEFEAHLKKSFPAMDKFERVAVMNFLREAVETALAECEPIKYGCGTCDGAKTLHHTLACMTVADYKKKVKKFLEL